MNKNITEELGGMQHLSMGLVEAGDKITFSAGGERMVDAITDGDWLIGWDVKDVKDIFYASVYRKMPVAKQGGLDHEFPQGFPFDFPGLEAICCPHAVGIEAEPEGYIPQDSQLRKEAPMFRGLLGYFPAALFEVAFHSQESEKKHNPGATDGPTWARGKSSDHADCIVRHLIDAGDTDTENRLEHLRALAWRSLALLQEECERIGAKPGVSSRFPND